MKKSILLKIISLSLVAIMMLFAVGCDLEAIFGDIDVDGNGQYEDFSNIYNQMSDKIPSDGDGKFTPDLTAPDFSTEIGGGELDFEGQEIAILYRDHAQNSKEWYNKTPEDELDEAITKRNEKVQDELNVKIVWIPVPATNLDYDTYSDVFISTVMNDVNSGIHSIDISSNHAHPTAYTTIRDYTTNLLDTYIFPYFDFDSPAWNQSIVENTTFNDRLHYIAGDVNLSMFDAAVVVWHNKTLYDEKKLDTDPENMQQLALDGLWNYDELYRWTSVFYENTSSADSGRDSKDTYALLADSKEESPSAWAFQYAWDLDFIATNLDGTHSFNIIDNQKIEDALTKCRNLLRGVGTYSSDDASLFAQGNSIFYIGRLYAGYEQNLAMREMDDRYGLMPMPKYNLYQKQYTTTAQNNYSLMFVLDHSECTIPIKGEAVSAFLQYSTELTHSDVLGYYFNRVVKPKYFGLDNVEGTVTRSIAIFDIISNNIVLDFYHIYSPQLDDIAYLWGDVISPSSGVADSTFQHTYSLNKNKFEQAIIETDTWLGLRAE